MTIEANKLYLATLDGAPVGMVGDLTYSVERADNSVVIPPSTTSIVEQSPGSYTATRTAPVGPGTYVSVWYSAVYEVSSTEVFEVIVVGLVEAGLRYASPNDLRTHLGQPDLPDEQLIRPLRLAQRDIDFAAGVWPVQRDTGLKFVTDETLRFPLLLDHQRNRLREATCEQAEYRMLMGDDFMSKDQYSQESGPDYSTTGKLRKVNGAVYMILAQAGLLKLGGRILGPRRRYADDRFINGLPNDA